MGGDLFAIVWDAETQKLYGLNASGRSPRSLTLEEFRSRGLQRVPPYGVLPVTVPGCVDGWFALHERFGKLPMGAILAPAIRYAREGFPVSELIAHYWQLSVPARVEYPGFLETFTSDGQAPRKGEIWRNPPLADTLEKIARSGRDVFYRGEIAHTIGDYMQRHGGFLSYEDLAAHHSEWVEPVSTTYRGWEVWELPPNGQGIAVLQILNILEGYDIGFPPQAKYGVVDKAKLTEYMDVLKQDGQIAKIPPIDAITTTSFTECINAFDGDQVRKLAREWK